MLLQSLALLGKQACILDCDHRLGREAFQYGDLAFRERTDLQAVRADKAKQDAVLAQRHREKCPHVSAFDGTPSGRVIRADLERLHICYVDEALAAHQEPEVRVGAERPAHHCGVPLWETMNRYGAEVLAVKGHQGTNGGAA